MSELKPCPLCGSDNVYVDVIKNPFSNDMYSRGHCGKCQMVGTFFAESWIEGGNKPSREYMENKALEQWNTRPIEDALKARIAELEAKKIRLGIEYQRMRLALGDIAINSKRALKESPNDTQKDETVYRKDKTPGIDWDKVPPVINPDELKLFKQSFDDD